jgi:cell division septation protein DedD
MSEPEIIGPDEAFEEPRQGLGRGVKLFAGAAVAVGVVALAGVVWFAYQQGVQSGTETTAPVIKADAEPVKRKPEEPGGMDVPHQDKLVFNRLAPGQAEEPLEKLLPPPEEPQERPEAVAAPEAPAVETPKPLIARAAEPAPDQVASAPPPPPAPSKPAAVVTAPPVPPAPTPPAPAKAAAADASGAVNGWRIQLASVSSRERALAEWDRLKGRNTDLLGPLSLNVEAAELTKGTFYRIQAGPLGDRAAASSLCGKLKSRNLDCLVVAP